MAELKDWSTTAANNNNATPNGWPENQSYSSVNDCGREMMAVIARWYKDGNGTLTTGGSSNAYTLTPNRTISAYADGDTFLIEANHTNTGAATLNVSALGAKSIVTQAGAALGAGAITSGGRYFVSYDGTNFQLIGAYTEPATISAIAALATTDGNFIVGNGSTWVAESGATARTSMGAAATGAANTFTDTNNFTGTLQVGGVAIDEYIADTAGAMFTGNTETGITATYQDADNTIDLVVDFASNAETLAGSSAVKAVTPAGLQYRLNPCGVMYRSSTQSGFSTATKVQFNATDVNALLRGAFDTSTNYRYTATDACNVLVTFHTYFTGLDAGNEVTAEIRRNGTSVAVGLLRNDSNGNSLDRSITVSKIVSLTAGQYLEAYITHDGASITLSAGLAYTYMQVLELN